MLMILSAVMVVLIVGVSVFAPSDVENDPRPTTYNSGPQGAKAAYLTLQELGRNVSRLEKPLSALSDADAGRTTLVLAEPVYAETDRDELKEQVKQFLERGGRVVATGETGALLLPEAKSAAPELLAEELCETTPEGESELARAGSVEMHHPMRWSALGPQFRVDQRCGGDGVVAHFAVGEGEAVWWSSADPMTNAELKHEGDLRLLLASIGDGRNVVFDEALQTATETSWSATKGLPLTWLALQAAALFVLLVLSFSRRRGPIRMPVVLPRSSPVEFANSMGDLYEKAHATSAATEAARRRLLRVLTLDAGVMQSAIQRGPAAIAEALHQRLGGDWQRLAGHLTAAESAAKDPVSERSGLALVRKLSEDAAAVREAIAPREVVKVAEEPELAGTRE
jgi:hypothetical protein